jgi:hypothetical protein
MRWRWRLWLAWGLSLAIACTVVHIVELALYQGHSPLVEAHSNAMLAPA